ncbi:MAG: thioesterase family protein [Phycisphaerales bacterium]
MTSGPAQGRTTLRVRYAECDPMGVAHHASYAPWLEHARTELLRDSGQTYESLERAGVFLVVTKMEIRYRRPVRYDDIIEVRTRVEGGSRVRIQHDYEIAVIERAGCTPDPADPAFGPGGVVAVGSTTLACVGADGRPRELPEWLIPSEPA